MSIVSSCSRRNAGLESLFANRGLPSVVNHHIKQSSVNGTNIFQHARISHGNEMGGDVMRSHNCALSV